MFGGGGGGLHEFVELAFLWWLLLEWPIFERLSTLQIVKKMAFER